MSNYNKIKQLEDVMEEIELQKNYIEKIKNLKLKNVHYFILTMGCKLNENDSEHQRCRPYVHL